MELNIGLIWADGKYGLTGTIRTSPRSVLALLVPAPAMPTLPSGCSAGDIGATETTIECISSTEGASATSRRGKDDVPVYSRQQQRLLELAPTAHHLLSFPPNRQSLGTSAASAWLTDPSL
jgi:hypothetical protein